MLRGAPILFGAASETLRLIAVDPKHLDAHIGFLAALHTWGKICFLTLCFQKACPSDKLQFHGSLQELHGPEQ